MPYIFRFVVISAANIMILHQPYNIYSWKFQIIVVFLLKRQLK